MPVLGGCPRLRFIPQSGLHPDGADWGPYSFPKEKHELFSLPTSSHPLPEAVTETCSFIIGSRRRHIWNSLCKTLCHLVGKKGSHSSGRETQNKEPSPMVIKKTKR